MGLQAIFERLDFVTKLTQSLDPTPPTQWIGGVIMSCCIALLLVISVTYFFLRYGPFGQKRDRFRKRDKIMFYGRRFIRRLRKIKRKQLKRLTQISKPPILWTGNPGNDTGTDLPSRGFKTVAIFPNSIEVPVCSFSRELHHNLVNNNVIHLTSETVLAQLGRDGFQDELVLQSWLEQQEETHRVVIYQCDLGLTEWSRICLNRAKCILVVALAQSEPHITYYEQQLYSQSPAASIELVLLHKLDAKKPKHTNIWLSIRSWCPIHHIRCPQRVFVRKRCKIEEVYSKLARTCPSADNDFSRLARYLTGTSIGLVLGGGGARGAAHLGIIKALHEANIPIDMIGGVSIGAFMGALWAQETDLTTVTQLARDWSIKMTSRLRQIVDLTYPITAMFTGAAFNRTIHEAFGDRQIEDLWIPYFTVTTDITSSAPRIHRHGSLWRYVRSSMSLSGYLPPLCDPIDGHLLLDGGYVNNLPADIMHDVMGAKTILAIDVGSQDETDLTDYGDTLNGWWLLWKRWNPFCEPVKVPSLPEIQSRLAYVSCVRQLEEVKRKDYCSYIRPPIDPYKTMQFHAFDRILDIGYEHGRLMFPDEKALTQQ